LNVSISLVGKTYRKSHAINILFCKKSNAKSHTLFGYGFVIKGGMPSSIGAEQGIPVQTW